jgi:hypothetical protein
MDAWLLFLFLGKDLHENTLTAKKESNAIYRYLENRPLRKQKRRLLNVGTNEMCLDEVGMLRNKWEKKI